MNSRGWAGRSPAPVRPGPRVAPAPVEPAQPALALRVLGVLVMLVLAGLLVTWGIDLGRRIGGIGGAGPAAAAAPPQAELDKVTAERDQLAVDAAAMLSEQKKTATQIKALEVENGKLSGDLELVESLVAPPPPGAGLLIRGVRARMLAPDRLHYVLLLAHGPRKGQPHFDGQLQLSVAMQVDGARQVIEFPGRDGADGAQYGVRVQRYQRLDGVLAVPRGAQVKTVQVRLLERGRVLAQQLATVKETPHVRP